MLNLCTITRVSMVLCGGLGASPVPTAGGSGGGSVYVPWNPSLIVTALGNLRSQIGTAFNVAIWIFIILSGLYLVFSLVSRFGR